MKKKSQPETYKISHKNYWNKFIYDFSDFRKRWIIYLEKVEERISVTAEKIKCQIMPRQRYQLVLKNKNINWSNKPGLLEYLFNLSRIYMFTTEDVLIAIL